MNRYLIEFLISFSLAEKKYLQFSNIIFFDSFGNFLIAAPSAIVFLELNLILLSIIFCDFLKLKGSTHATSTLSKKIFLSMIDDGAAKLPLPTGKIPKILLCKIFLSFFF